MLGKSQCRSGRKKCEVLPGAPRLVDAPKITAIQMIRGSQYLQSRPDTPAKNNAEPSKATGKAEVAAGMLVSAFGRPQPNVGQSFCSMVLIKSTTSLADLPNSSLASALYAAAQCKTSSNNSVLRFLISALLERAKAPCAVCPHDCG